MTNVINEVFDETVKYIVSDDMAEENDSDVLKLSQIRPENNNFIIIATKSMQYMEQMEDNHKSRGFVRGKHYITI